MATPSALELEDLAHKRAPAFAAAVTKAATESHNEREFQSQVAVLLSSFAKDLGVTLEAREEYVVASGRADAVFNRFVIEYEPPGSLRANRDHKHTAHAVGQAVSYIEGLAEQGHAKNRLLAAAFDGHFLYFVRWTEDGWDIPPAIEWGDYAAERFLKAVVSLTAGRALRPENLVEDFGSDSPRAREAIKALYLALGDEHAGELGRALFKQWCVFFAEVSEYNEILPQLRSKKELLQFAEDVGLPPRDVDPARLFFSIHTYFSFLAKSIARLVLERYAAGTLGATPLTRLASLSSASLRTELEKLEEGGIFASLGFSNLLEGDFFRWYLGAWTSDVYSALQTSLARLAEYNPATIEQDPHAARDLLKKLYHYLMPRELRHDLGAHALAYFREPIEPVIGVSRRNPVGRNGNGISCLVVCVGGIGKRDAGGRRGAHIRQVPRRVVSAGLRHAVGEGALVQSPVRVVGVGGLTRSLEPKAQG